MPKGLFSKKLLRQYHKRYVLDIHAIQKELKTSWKSGQHAYRDVKSKLNWDRRNQVTLQEILDNLKAPGIGLLLDAVPPDLQSPRFTDWYKKSIRWGDLGSREKVHSYICCTHDLVSPSLYNFKDLGVTEVPAITKFRVVNRKTASLWDAEYLAKWFNIAYSGKMVTVPSNIRGVIGFKLPSLEVPHVEARHRRHSKSRVQAGHRPR